MVELRDPYTAGHQRRVGDIAAAIGEELKLSEDQIKGLRFSGYVHDIGKISIPAEILSKPGRLTGNEFALIKTHSQQGYDVLKGIDFPWPIARAILEHHERVDGSGYPRGLKGEQISLEARILAVADTVEAMSSHRPYRAALGLDAAMREIQEQSGKRYDERVVAACLRLLRAGSIKLAA
jgi:HD-GYP domain-containing protein (c-di-GMP phosphodiesterase class II)